MSNGYYSPLGWVDYSSIEHEKKSSENLKKYLAIADLIYWELKETRPELNLDERLKLALDLAEKERQK